MCMPYQAQARVRQQENEYTLKAAFIYNFIRFTRWENGTKTNNSNTALHLNIIGPNLFGNSLLPPTKKTISGRQIIIITTETDEEAVAQCPAQHILFITYKSVAKYTAVLNMTKGKQALTISDTKGFASQGGCIELIQLEGKTRFIINRKAVRQQGLELSYQVYNLALEVVE